MDEYGQRLKDTVGPYNEGAHLTLVCEAEGGKQRTFILNPLFTNISPCVSKECISRSSSGSMCNADKYYITC